MCVCVCVCGRRGGGAVGRVKYTPPCCPAPGEGAGADGGGGSSRQTQGGEVLGGGGLADTGRGRGVRLVETRRERLISRILIPELN